MESIKNYITIKPIGQGGMSDVYLVRDKNTGARFAMKQLRAERKKLKRSLVRFRREANLLAQLQHPNIIHVFDHGESDGSYYIIMEYIDGSNLKQKIREDGLLDPHLAFKYLFQITAALVCAHDAGIVHRDIKPANILLTKDDKAILTDFGIAKDLYSETDFTKAGTALGTPQYMSPEQITSKKDIDSSTDIYSLGILLFEMLVGKTPYAGLDFVAVAQKHVREPVPELPAVFAKYQPLLNAMMQKKRRLRLHNASALYEYLGHFVTTSTTSEYISSMQTDTYNEALYADDTEDDWSKKQTQGDFDDESECAQAPPVPPHLTGTHKGVDSDALHMPFWQRALHSIFENNGLLISVGGGAFLLCVFILLRYTDPFANDVPTITARADLVSSAGHVQMARTLIRDDKILPPAAPNALNQLERAFAIEPGNDSVLTNLINIVLYAIDHYTEQDQLDFPSEANALAMTDKLKEYAPQSIWQPSRVAILTLLLEQASGDNDVTQDKLFGYVIELLQLDPHNQEAHAIFSAQVAHRRRIAYRLAAATEYTKAADIAALLYQVTDKEEYQAAAKRWRQQATKNALQEYVGALVPIAGNCYTMGSSEYSVWHRQNEPQSEQCVADFAMSQYEITVRQYQSYCNQVNCTVRDILAEQGASKPITYISWHDIQQYIAWLNQKTNDYHFSLPTEQEWEYAARASSQEKQYYWGDSMESGFANCLDCGSATGGLRAAVVGSFAANNFGLYDMLGNVWEWTCSDYTKIPLATTATPSRCSINSATTKVIRGGSWLSDAGDTRVSVRYGLLPESRAYDLGFRLVRRVGQPEKR